MAERGRIRLGQVLDQRAGRAGRQRVVVAAEALEGADAEMALQPLGRRVGAEAPGVVWRQRERAQRRRQVGRRAAPPIGRRHEQLGRADALELLGDQARQLLRPAARRHQLAAAELAGRDVHVREAGPCLAERQCGQEVVPLGVEQPRLGDRAGRDDPRDRAVDQPAAGRRVADLLADRDPVAARDQAGEVAIERLVRDAGQRVPAPLAHLAPGQRDLELARDDLGVLIEGLVEVAHPKEQNRVRVLALEALVLLPDRRPVRPCSCRHRRPDYAAWPIKAGRHMRRPARARLAPLAAPQTEAEPAEGRAEQRQQAEGRAAGPR